MQRLLAFEFNSNAASFKLFDQECMRLKQVAGIDIQDEVKCWLVAAPPGHAREQARCVLQGQRAGAGHRLRCCRRCSALADRCSEWPG